jgi:hypothetical protein
MSRLAISEQYRGQPLTLLANPSARYPDRRRDTPDRCPGAAIAHGPHPQLISGFWPPNASRQR